MFDQRALRLHTSLPDTSLFFRSLSGGEALSTIGGYQLVALSPSPDLPLDDLVGHPATLEIDLPKGGVRYVNQYVASMALVGKEGQHYRYEAELRPWFWFLTRTADWKIFQKLSTLDIVKKVFGDHGIARFEDRTTQSYPQRRYCVQAGETDANFIMRLLEQEGIYFYFEHKADQHVLVLADGLPAHKPRPDYEVIPYEVGASDGGMRVDDEHFAAWRCGKQVESTKFIVNDYDYFRPSAKLQQTATESRPHGQAQHDIYLWPSEYYAPDRGQHFADMRVEAAQARYQTASGSGPIEGLCTGQLFSLIDFPRQDQNQQYLVTSEHLLLEENTYESTGTGMAQRQCQVTVIPSKTPFRPERNTPKPYVQGTQTARVVGPAGEEIYCDEKGRVKIQFHWDRYGPNNEQSGCWVRVSSAWAGQSYGATSIPRIGQEVLVSFIEGDPDRPIITGRVYNEEQPTPFGNASSKTQSGLYSRSSPGGGPDNANILRFEDKKGAEEVWLHAEKDQRIEVENDESHSVGHDRSKTIGHDETVHVKHDRTETVDNNETITIGVNRTETVGSNETISIGANQALTVGDNQTVTVGKNKAETVAIAKALSVGAGYAITVGGAMNTGVGLAQFEEVGLNKTVVVGKTLSITAGDKFELKVGKSSFIMDSDGNITLKGVKILVEGSGPMTLIGKDVDINP
ncbi:type VI secretion system secreted protein VgrG [Andreprevotia lacus DSM 23236]|jgi:type VI secretion system secreted protein VgrG|uniref:Type VI secretion system secreted protein VgrG n=1 Tax=Andreprevotia lacus DSM 23236 TaxID=1121001 RepID=A0A1W1XWY3_9NEIS|nr:type VI secretion system tip protein TssI/VgrG [Andreprevotia lacus]SMC28479.1 type VI secretion system secreted protein VgrG [Andreprevotia lacus DSM 23236]